MLITACICVYSGEADERVDHNGCKAVYEFSFDKANKLMILHAIHVNATHQYTHAAHNTNVYRPHK